MEIIDSGSFSKAAKNLSVSQSGISRMVSDLEESFGFRILERDRNGVELTYEGEAILPYIRALISDYLSMEGSAASLKEMGKGHIV